MYREKENRVVDGVLNSGDNFFKSDLLLKEFVNNHVSSDAFTYMHDQWTKTGKSAANEMNEWSYLADKFGPELIRRNMIGEDIFEIRFHPSYDSLLKVAVESEMLHVKWEPKLRKKYKKELHTLGFVSGYLFSLTEQGQYCPLCMTDGVARLIDKYCKQEVKDKLLPGIYTKNAEQLLTGAMYLTEKRGGSDVGANIVSANKAQKDTFLLNGEKWFCSNANADIIFALARTDNDKKGTKGLSIFLLEKYLKNGEKNPIEILRLKDKLGVRSMASAECMLKDTEGLLVGEEFNGFKVMLEMINLSRLYNSLAALSAGRRAIVEAYTFLKQRKTFGKIALEHALVKDKLGELAALNIISFYMTWKSIQTLDKADNGDENAKISIRLLTPMVKKFTAENSVYLCRESMELMGGLGYIEDGIIPRLMRDVMVLPIWEGAGNIMILDMLRASLKDGALEKQVQYIKQTSFFTEEASTIVSEKLHKLLQTAESFKKLNGDELEFAAKYFFLDFMPLVQLAILEEYSNEANQERMIGAKEYLLLKITKKHKQKPYTKEDVINMMAWNFD
ncbi:MAG: acyl-CoA dehydrogenase [Chitinophagaceae bacterium]|nr:MAG: acyl-CoA dehydrogenase [Chitinophagaceae bacterium]